MLPLLMVDVTIIIVNWNGGALLFECVNRLRMQRVKPVRIIVMDNNSSDESIVSIKHFTEVEIILINKNSGFAAANNQAVKLISSKYVLFLNPDALPEFNWLKEIFNAVEKKPEVAAFGSRQMMLHNKEFLDGLGDVYHMSGLAWRKGFGHRLPVGTPGVESIFSVCACAVLMKTEVFNELGGFDEDYFCYFEDVDLGFRLNLAGYKTHVVYDAVVYHAGSASTGGGRSAFSIYHGHRNMVWTYFKNMPGLLFWILLPVHVFFNLVSILFFIYKGYGAIILKAKWDALKGLPKMWKKRHQIQAVRRISALSIWKLLNKSLVLSRD